ncbi:NUDIX domain-containing protein [Flavobacteriaceae bacterium]|nr:NUDIX domain-containing protein [Flavobacteriaceae bacterium]
MAGFTIMSYKDLDFQVLFKQILNDSNLNFQIICDDLESNWKHFKTNFQVREAAGGLVFNEDDELLWIYRFDKWDLPKGHIEKGESKEIAAIREVEEECNVTDLTIKKPLETTYHVFMHKGITVLKVTYWFLMDTTYKGALVPQVEEGITDVCFKSRGESKTCLSNTYQNIEILLKDIL